MVELQSKPALIVVDMQNGFCSPEGSFAKLGFPVAAQTAIVPAIQKLLTACRARGIPVFYSREGWNEDYSDSGILLASQFFAPIKELKGFIRDTWDYDIIDDLKPAASDIILHKPRPSCFLMTDFAEQLEQRGINQLIVTGVGTNVCVECTVRDAWQLGFYTVTVSDATAAVSQEEHDGTLRNLKYFGGTATVAEVIEALYENS
ncbi:Isochorismatase hydrolase [Rhizodiscina lignyota]|uniref:Isochorismatase hydrolase n=1 Tax=Rhizodiscina lignyota TaxID=1504668 RepID=A0A9P4M3W4_9PEZI|nr:Isochorismatase hydrolase [Rhizodiscina lignyota]